MFSSNSKQKAIERFGNPVRINKNGNELVFKCIKCGREKLYYNVQTAIYHCFRCDYSGKLRVRVSMSDLRNRYNMDGLKKVTNTTAGLLPHLAHSINLIPFPSLQKQTHLQSFIEIIFQ